VPLPTAHGSDEVMVRFAGEAGRGWANSFRSLLAAMAERRRYVVDLADAVGSPAILEELRAGLVDAATRAGSTVRFARLAPTMVFLPVSMAGGRSSW
jgi:choline dehydrogenase-like flavoprotein